jgi:hypothetical protein
LVMEHRKAIQKHSMVTPRVLVIRGSVLLECGVVTFGL